MNLLTTARDAFRDAFGSEYGSTFEVEAEKLGEPLGEINGHAWYTGPSWRPSAEVEVTGRVFEALDPLPPGPILRRPDRRYAELVEHRSGTFEALRAEPKPPKPPKPHRPADALALLTVLARTTEHVVARAPSTAGGTLVRPRRPEERGPYIRPAAGPIRGPEAILAALAKRGVLVGLNADRTALVVTGPGGRVTLDPRAVIEAAGPLLLAYLKGSPLHCTVTVHAEPVDAVTIALGGSPWCGECSPEVAS